MNCICFSWFFNLIFNFLKNKNAFLLRCSLHCAHILKILVSIILALSWHLFLFLVFWFFQLPFFMKAVLKVFWPFSVKYLMFRMFDIWFFLFFCSLQENRSLYWTTSYLFYVSNAEQWNVFVFLEFFFYFWFSKIKNVFLLRCSSYCVHVLIILVSIILVLSWQLFMAYLFSVVSVVEKLNDFSIFVISLFAIDFIQHKAVLRVC